MNDQLDRIEDRLERIERMLTGNGDPEKSIVVRLDRVTQFVKVRRWLERAIIGAILGLIIAQIFR